MCSFKCPAPTKVQNVAPKIKTKLTKQIKC